MLGDRVVEPHHAAIPQEQHRQRGEALGHRGDAEHAVRSRPFLALQVEGSEPAGVDQATSMDDAVGDTRDVAGFVVRRESRSHLVEVQVQAEVAVEAGTRLRCDVWHARSLSSARPARRQPLRTHVRCLTHAPLPAGPPHRGDKAYRRGRGRVAAAQHRALGTFGDSDSVDTSAARHPRTGGPGLLRRGPLAGRGQGLSRATGTAPARPSRAIRRGDAGGGRALPGPARTTRDRTGEPHHVAGTAAGSPVLHRPLHRTALAAAQRDADGTTACHDVVRETAGGSSLHLGRRWADRLRLQRTGAAGHACREACRSPRSPRPTTSIPPSPPVPFCTAPQDCTAWRSRNVVAATSSSGRRRVHQWARSSTSRSTSGTVEWSRRFDPASG